MGNEKEWKIVKVHGHEVVTNQLGMIKAFRLHLLFDFPVRQRMIYSEIVRYVNRVGRGWTSSENPNLLGSESSTQNIDLSMLLYLHVEFFNFPA